MTASARIEAADDGPVVPAALARPTGTPTIRCSDYRAHQLWHRRTGDVWRCEVCRFDADHAEPIAEQVAFEWAFDDEAPV